MQEFRLIMQATCYKTTALSHRISSQIIFTFSRFDHFPADRLMYQSTYDIQSYNAQGRKSPYRYKRNPGQPISAITHDMNNPGSVIFRNPFRHKLPPLRSAYSGSYWRSSSKPSCKPSYSFSNALAVPMAELEDWLPSTPPMLCTSDISLSALKSKLILLG